MKQRLNKGLAYPLLRAGRDDYINGKFTQKISNTHTGSEFTLKLNAELSCSSLQKLIDTGKAGLLYHLECPTTGYREIIETDFSEHKKSIPFAKLRGTLDVNTFIVAKEKIDNYTSSDFNEDYEGVSFDIEAGCRLAEADIYSVEIPKKYTDLLEKNDPYVIVIPNTDPDEKAAIIDVNGPKIRMIVPEQASINFGVLQQTAQMRPILHSMYIVPAVYQGQLYLSGLDDLGLQEASDRLWVQSMEEELKKTYHVKLSDLRNQEIGDLYRIAQAMCGNPLLPGAEYLAKKKGDQSDED